MQTHSRIVLLGVWLLTAPVGCAEVDGKGSEEVALKASGITTPAWRAYWDYAGEDIDTLADWARDDGYRPISVSAYNTASDPRYAAVFVGRTGPAWRMLRGTGVGGFQTVFEAQASQNYKPALLSFDGAATNPVWAAVFVETTTGIPFTRSALTSGSYLDETTIEYWIRKARLEKLIPTTLSIYGSSSNPRYAIVVEPNTANVQWTVGRISADQTNVWGVEGVNDSSADFQARWSAQVPAWNRPALLDLQQNDRYIGMFSDDSVGPLEGRHSLTAESLATEVENRLRAGLFPIAIHGGGSDTNARYAVVFAQSELPQQRVFTARGSAATNDTAIVSIDNAVRDFMARNNVRQASLAIASNRRLAYARGYTHAEPGYPQATPATHFRLASLSKTVTAMEVMRLVDRNIIALTDKVQSILNLTTPTGGQPDARFATISIRDLLAHDYPTLNVGTTRRCLLRDASVGPEVAAAFGTSLPVTMNQMARNAMTHIGLISDSPSGSCYSNFAYNLLAMVVAKRRVTSFSSALRSDLFNPLGITRFRIASSDLAAQPADEAIYRPFGLWTDYSINSSSRPLVSAPYGSDGNWSAWAGSGGMSMAAPDLLRLLVNLNLRTSNPVYRDTTTTDGDPATISQILGNPLLGFDGSFSDSTGTHVAKGGYISGLQSEAYYTQNGISYVLFWAHNEVPNSGNAADNWYPSWEPLNTAIAGANLGSRPDLFPNYGMASFP